MQLSYRRWHPLGCVLVCDFVGISVHGTTALRSVNKRTNADSGILLLRIPWNNLETKLMPRNSYCAVFRFLSTDYGPRWT